MRALRRRGHLVAAHRHMPRRGMAEQRQFLLNRSRAPFVHYLDDDVLLDPPVLGRMQAVTLRSEGAGLSAARRRVSSIWATCDRISKGSNCGMGR